MAGGAIGGPRNASGASIAKGRLKHEATATGTAKEHDDESESQGILTTRHRGDGGRRWSRAFGSSARAADTINVAGIHDLSGGLDIYGKPMVDALTLAVEEANAAGGLLGQQIKLINYDPQFDDAALYAVRPAGGAQR